jgi:transposase
MNLHANAALSLNRRRQLCRRVLDEKWTLTQAAAAAEVSVRCARKWVGRYRTEGELGLLDRSSAPNSIPHRTEEKRIEAIAALRRLRFTGPEIAEILGMALSTVSGILTRIGMGKLGRLGLEPAVRYERERPGELIQYRRQEARQDPGWRRTSHRRSAAQEHGQGRPPRQRTPPGRLGVRAHRDRRLHPPGLRRGARR